LITQLPPFGVTVPYVMLFCHVAVRYQETAVRPCELVHSVLKSP
jgi:hypothetical protein